MSLHQTLVQKYRGKPVLLIVAAVGFTFSIYGFYRHAYKPWSRRKQLKESEEYANFIFDRERK